MWPSDLLTFVPRKEFLKRYDKDKQQQDNEDALYRDV
jgi:hypothetical protein